MAQKNQNNRSGYFAEYYRKNRERILKERKKRYDKEEEYRKSCLKQSQRSWKEHKGKGGILVRKDGETYLTTKGLAKKLQVTQKTIRSLIERKVIPEPEIVDFYKEPLFGPQIWRQIIVNLKGEALWR